MHNCWSTCATDAALMLAQIQAFAQDATPTNLDPESGREQGADADRRARSRAAPTATMPIPSPSTCSSEGAGSTIAYDTSGIDPAADLTLTGHYQCDGSWGVIFLARRRARRRRPSQASSKLNTLIQATGEFSIEAWVAPARSWPPQSVRTSSSYSGGDTLRNFTLGADQPGL